MDINIRGMARIVALTMFVISFAMIPPMICASFEENQTLLMIFAISFFSLLISGIVGLRYIPRTDKNIKIRDGYMGIFLVIVVSIIVGAFPYFYGIPDATFVDAIFESTAGFSTTSATVFYEPDMDKSLLLWKSIEHWLGGVSVLIFIMAILPLLGVGDQQIATVEAHGPLQNKIAPRTKDIVRYIIIIYVVLTVLAFIYFMLGGIGLFDSLIMCMSTSSTSGVLLYPEGISYYDSTYIELGVSGFCILAGMSFVMYIHWYKKDFAEAKENIEFRVFMFIIGFATIVIAILLHFADNDKTLLMSVKDAFFQVSSFATTSGFALEDYTLWPAPCCYILLCLMIIGGCSASTTGALKVMRLVIIVKLISRSIGRKLHPRSIAAIRVGNSKISSKMLSSVTSFGIIYFATMLLSVLILSLQDLDMATTFSAALGAISNDGISFGEIGMSGEYSMFHPVLKLYLSFLMVVGRLGFITVFIVFLPSFWNPDKRRHIT